MTAFLGFAQSSRWRGLGAADERRQGDAQCLEDGAGGGRRRVAQQVTFSVLLDLSFAQAFEIVDDVGPFELVADGEEAILQLLAQDQGEKGAEDVTADGVVAFVEDRAGGEQRFCGAEDVLDHPALAIAQDGLERGKLGVGAQHVDAVEESVEGDAARIDFETTTGFEAEKAAIAAVAHQAARPQKIAEGAP